MSTGAEDEVAERFTVASRAVPEAGAVVLAVAGELDHDSADELQDSFRKALESRPARVLVDCSALRFCDSTGLNALLRARMTAVEAGVSLELAAMQASVARLFEITGATDVFASYATLDDALDDAIDQRRT